MDRSHSKPKQINAEVEFCTYKSPNRSVYFNRQPFIWSWKKIMFEVQIWNIFVPIRRTHRANNSNWGVRYFRYSSICQTVLARTIFHFKIHARNRNFWIIVHFSNDITIKMQFKSVTFHKMIFIWVIVLNTVKRAHTHQKKKWNCSF